MISCAEYERVVAQRDELQRGNDALRLENSLLRTQLRVHSSNDARVPVIQVSADQNSQRQLTQSSRPAKRARTAPGANGGGTLRELMRCVLQQAPTAMLCLLDGATQRSLRFVFPELVTTRRLNTARELYDAHWMNEPFYHSMLRVDCSSFNRHRTDLHLRVVRDNAAEISSSHYFDSPSNVGTSCWEATPRGALLKLYCWNDTPPGARRSAARRWSGRSICIDIKLLADRARRIVARSWIAHEYRSVDLIGARSEINRFDPELWHEDAQISSDRRYWLTMIVEYSRAREIVAFAPVLELAPNYIFE